MVTKILWLLLAFAYLEVGAAILANPRLVPDTQLAERRSRGWLWYRMWQLVMMLMLPIGLVIGLACAVVERIMKKRHDP